MTAPLKRFGACLLCADRVLKEAKPFSNICKRDVNKTQQVKNRDALTTKTSLSAELTGAFISVLVIYSNGHLFVFSNKQT